MLTAPAQGLVMGTLSGLSAAAECYGRKRLGKKEYEDAYRESRKV